MEIGTLSSENHKIRAVNASLGLRQNLLLLASAAVVTLSLAAPSYAQSNDVAGFDVTTPAGCTSTAITSASTNFRTNNDVSGQSHCIGSFASNNDISGADNNVGAFSDSNTVSGDNNTLGSFSDSNNVSGANNALDGDANLVSGNNNTLESFSDLNNVSGAYRQRG